MAARKKQRRHKPSGAGDGLPADHVPPTHRFPEDADPSPYHDGRDPDESSDDDGQGSDGDDDPHWLAYRETFADMVVQHPLEQHRSAAQLRALDEKVLRDLAALEQTCAHYAAVGAARGQALLARAHEIEGWCAARLAREPVQPVVPEGAAADGVDARLQDTLVPAAGDAAAPAAASAAPAGSAAVVYSSSTAAPSWTVASSSSHPTLTVTSAASSALPPSTATPPPAGPTPTPVYTPHQSYAHLSHLLAAVPLACKEKVSLAQDAYEKTDRHIRTLDTELAAHTLAGRRVREVRTSDDAGGAGGGDGDGRAGGEERDEYDADDDDDGSVLEVQFLPEKPARRKGGDKKASASSSGGRSGKKGAAARATGINGGQARGRNGEVLKGADIVRHALEDGLINPNEPRYCYCDLPSWGVMVACDNDECNREWFHLCCLNMTHAPRDKWFCAECAQAAAAEDERPLKRRKF